MKEVSTLEIDMLENVQEMPHKLNTKLNIFQIVGLLVIQLVNICKFIHNDTDFLNITDSFCR